MDIIKKILTTLCVLMVLPLQAEVISDNSIVSNFEEGSQTAEGFWTIGDIKLENANDSTQTFKVRSSGKSSLLSNRFVRKVGGVNFEKTAITNSISEGMNIELFYNPNASDGNRLTVKIDLKNVNIKIHDWLLIPIAYFADSKFTAVISLFGSGPNTDDYYYIQYHPAFHNTLLGVRLLQADILLMDPQQHINIPKTNGHLVLGNGESSFKNYNTNNIFMKTLYEELTTYEYTAWILTDIETIPSFSISNGNIKFYSSPYYYFWYQNERDINAHNSAINRYNDHVNEYNKLVEDTQNNISKYTNLVSDFNSENSYILKQQLNLLEITIKSQELKITNIQEKMNNLQNIIEQEIKVQPVTPLTNYLMTTNVIQKINAIVHNATKTTTDFTSFFRYVKLNHSSSWKTFIKSLSNVKIKPSVKTPTRMKRI